MAFMTPENADKSEIPTHNAKKDNTQEKAKNTSRNAPKYGKEDLEALLEQNPAIQKQDQQGIETLIEEDRHWNGPRFETESKKDQIKNDMLNALTLDVLENTFEQTLENNEFTQREIDQIIEKAYKDMDAQERLRMFAMLAPYESKARLANTVRNKLNNGDLEIDEVPEYLLTEADKKEIMVGFHVSDNEIQPQKDGNWEVSPTEKGENGQEWSFFSRVSDKSWEQLYDAESQPDRLDIDNANDYLYLTRAAGDNTVKHMSGGWSQVKTQSVIARLDLQGFNKYVKNKADQIIEEEEEE